jgi:integrase
MATNSRLPSIVTSPPNELALAPSTVTAIVELLEEGQSLNTVRTYQSALAYWVAWYGARYQRPFPLLQAVPDALPINDVLQFIVDHVDRTIDGGLKNELPSDVRDALIADGTKRQTATPALSTTLLRLAVMAKAHSLRKLPNPLNDGGVRELIKRIKRAYAARGQGKRPKKAVPREPLEAMLATCDDTLRGKRDRALLLFAWASGGRRRSEVADATMEHLHRVSDEQFVYRLLRSKTNQEGIDDGHAAKPIIGAAARALSDWLAAARIVDGRIFRSLRNGGVGTSLTAHSVALIVKARAALAGLEGDYSGHSLRSGFVTEAGLQAKPLADVMRLSGHKSVPQAMAYYQHGDVLNSSVASLFDSQTK